MSDLNKILENPIAWAIGGIVSVTTVVSAVIVDPSSVLIALIDVLVANAASLFGAFSIAAFTLGPEIPWIPQTRLQQAAWVFGAIVILKVADSIWDTLKDRVDDD